jgi:hypothetical protein
MIHMLRGHANLTLLATIVAVLMLQPLVALGGAATRPLYDVLMVAIVVLTFLGLLGRGASRPLGLALIAPAVVANFAHYAFAGPSPVFLRVVFHASLALFLGFAVALQLRHILRAHAIALDDVFGAFAGYLLGAIAWAHLYALAELASPGAIAFAPAVAEQLADWHLRRSAFDYLSFAILTSLGWSDATPVRPPATTLAWLEVIAGQFYMAVVVATLVSRQLAARARGGDG